MSGKTVFDCFCGVGGISLGAAFAGLNVIAGVDVDQNAIRSYQGHFPKAIAQAIDLSNVSGKQLLRELGLRRGDVDFLVGGPPCQPYSVNNHQRSVTDGRASLFGKFLDIGSLLRPQWIVIENVPGLLSIENGNHLKQIIRSLRNRGYRTDYSLLDAVQFGVPQRRKRLVILATREREEPSAILKHLVGRKRRVRTVAQAFSDLPVEIGASHYSKSPTNDFQRIMREGNTNVVTGHLAAGLGLVNLKRIAHIPPGGNWRNIPRRLLPSGMKRAQKSDHTTRYGRLRKDKPSFTLLTKCDPHWGCFVHPDEDRVITVREAARLQSIPDRVQLLGTLFEQYKLIGNAVPPLLAQAIFEEL